MLQKEATPDAEEALRLITRGSDFIEEQDFTLIHKAVLGLTSTDLETALLQHPHDVDTPDRSNRTPLLWASALANEVHIALLLLRGANPNAADGHGSTPLYSASWAKSPTCCRLLLEAGAKTNPIPPRGTRPSTALANCCEIFGPTEVPLVIAQMLIDFGADVDARNADGRTALQILARRDNIDLMHLLLEAGADLHIESNSGETPLTQAITYNAHRALRLLLHRWHEYSECPRLKGPNLLGLAAAFGDIETMKILTGTDHLRLSYDISYSQEAHIKQLEARPDADEKLSAAFRDLLAVINMQPPAGPGETELEAGRQYRMHSKKPERGGRMPGSWELPEEEEEVEAWQEWHDEALDDALTQGLKLDET